MVHGMCVQLCNIKIIVVFLVKNETPFFVMLQIGKWNLAQLYEVHQCSGLNATLTNIVPRINSEATQGKQPLVWVEAVSSSVTSYFHFADRQNICQGGCSSALYSFFFFF